ncbi:unnamed protein product [Cochlearia groenlandica]
MELLVQTFLTQYRAPKVHRAFEISDSPENIYGPYHLQNADNPGLILPRALLFVEVVLQLPQASLCHLMQHRELVLFRLHTVIAGPTKSRELMAIADDELAVTFLVSLELT